MAGQSRGQVIDKIRNHKHYFYDQEKSKYVIIRIYHRVILALTFIERDVLLIYIQREIHLYLCQFYYYCLLRILILEHI